MLIATLQQILKGFSIVPQEAAAMRFVTTDSELSGLCGVVAYGQADDENLDTMELINKKWKETKRISLIVAYQVGQVLLSYCWFPSLTCQFLLSQSYKVSLVGLYFASLTEVNIFNAVYRTMCKLISMAA